MSGRLLRINDLGVIGSVLTTTGSVAAGSSQLTVASANGWKVGAGIGVASAGASGVTLQTSVTAIKGNVLTLGTVAQAGVVNAVVNSDDYVPIQAALDVLRVGGGGVALLDPGTYLIGTPNAPGNAPLFIGSGTTLRGAGKTLTTIKVCDNAKQLLHAQASKYPTPIHDLRQYPQAAAIVNYGNTFWHANQPFPAPGSPFLTPRDVGIGIEDLTIDGNGPNQVYAGTTGNRTQGQVPDSEYGFKFSGAAGGALIAGHLYRVAVTYTDAVGRETASNPAFTGGMLGAGQDAILIRLSNPPTGAQGVCIYVMDVTGDPVDTTTYPYFAPGATGPAWERQGPFAAATTGKITAGTNQFIVANASGWRAGAGFILAGAGANGAALTGTIIAIAGNVLTLSATAIVGVTNAMLAATSYQINAHSPGELYPPGLGTITVQGVDPAAATYGLFLDNCDTIDVRRVDIKSFARDGLSLATLDTDARQNTPALIPHPVTNARFHDMTITDCMRCGISLTGAVRNVFFNDVHAGGNTIGVDIEADSYPLPVDNVVWTNCSFRDAFISNRLNVAGIGGVTINPAENSPNRGIAFHGCLFDNNLAHAGISKNDGVVVFDSACVFSRAWTVAIGSSSLGAVVVSGCQFVQNGRVPGEVPTYYYGANEGGDILLGDTARQHANWAITGNIFIGEVGRGLHQAIQLGVHRRGDVVTGNIFGLVQTPYDPATQDNPANVCKILVYGAASDHIIQGNTGRFVVQDFRNNSFASPRIDGSIGQLQPAEALVQQHASGNALVKAGATRLDVTFIPDVVQSGVWLQRLAAAAYRPEVMLGWPGGGVYITNVTQTGFRINWTTPPANDAMLWWAAKYAPAQMTQYSVTPVNPVVPVDGKQQFQATAVYADDTSADAGGLLTLWSTDNPSRATVTQQGLLTRHQAGAVNLIARPFVATIAQTDRDANPIPKLPVVIAIS